MSDIFIGVMSGTSMDGIDIVAAKFNGNTPHIIAANDYPILAYKEEFLRIINAGSCSLLGLGELDVWSGEIFADTIIKFLQQNNLSKDSIAAIGSHGQTLWHAPRANKPFSIQIGDPNVIAVKTGITTIADFRRSDIAAGGQGAPLIPAFHQAVFANPEENRCILNIGGMSNVSLLENNKVIGFDSGPGNCLLDYWTQKHFNQPYDVDGKLAASGKVNNGLLQCMLDDHYFQLPPPKSTGREDFNPAWLDQKIQAAQAHNLTPIDILATLVQLTADSTTNAIKNYANANTKVYAFGGGIRNQTLRAKISQNLEQQIQSTGVLGVDSTWMEATLFAWLAKQRLNNIPINLTAITGSKHPVLLGGIYG